MPARGPLSLAAALAIATAPSPARTPMWELPAVAAEERLSAEMEAFEREQDLWHEKYDPRSMPAYYQDDPAWAGVPYAHGGTIAGNGCGLTAAAMSLEWWTREQWTPARLAAEVGDSCTVGGLNDMVAFAGFARSLGLAASERYWDLERAIADAAEGWTVWVSVSGVFGTRPYGGHIVLVWRDEAGALHVNDPACEENTRAWSAEELRRYAGSFKYAISVRKEF